VFFDHDKGKTHSSGKLLYSARVIPTAARGSTSSSTTRTSSTSASTAAARCTRRCSCARSATHAGAAQLLLRHRDRLPREGRKYSKSIEYDLLPGQRATRDIKVGSEEIVKKNRKFTRAAIRKLKESKLDRLPIELDELVGKVSRRGRHRRETGEVLLECNEELTEAKLDELREARHRELQGPLHRRPQRRQLPARHAARRQGADPEEAILEIYRRLRPGDPPTLETAKTLFTTCSSTPSATTSQGRPPQAELQVLPRDADERPPLDSTVLTKQDILETVRT
jgi:DNA-directed RNA polymerase subunit beta